MKRGRAAHDVASARSASPRSTLNVSRRWAILVGILMFCAAAAVGLGYAIRAGRGAAPDSTQPGPTQQGGGLPLASDRGHVVLVSFLDTQAQASRAGDPSRAQVVFLKSMAAQHQTEGLRALIVDAAHAVGKPEPTSQMLVNYGFDQALPASVLVIGDQGGAFARAYGVTAVPTTLLIDQHGVVKQRWDRFASAAELDFAITPLLGPTTRPPPPAPSS